MLTKILVSFIWLAAICYAVPVSYWIPGQDSTGADSVKVPKPDFAGVNVIVETDWGTTDKTENVDVFIRKEKGNHIDIVMKKSDHQECIVELVSGMKVKIVDRKTGKTLKTFKP